MRSRLPSLVLCFASLSAAALASCANPQEEDPVGEAACQLQPTRTFHERIEPLLAEQRVSTCNQCHLSGVDLSAFARETPCQTWACLVDQGLVDIEAPRESKILSWIERATPDSELITSEVIAAERDAFRDWIDANAACPQACAGVSCGPPGAGPTCAPANEAPPEPPEEDTRGCSDIELEQAFYDDVYAWRGRCFPCHFDTESKAEEAAPRWISAIGNCQTGSAASLKRVLGLGLIDTTDPQSSLLLQKPLGEKGGGVKHGGGAKFKLDDATYQSFLRFVTHYQSCNAR